MQHGYHRELARDEWESVLAAAGVPADEVKDVDRLGGGTYNTVHRVRTRHGSGLIVKLSPASSASILRYEHGILGTEARFNRLAADVGALVPEVRHVDVGNALLDGDVLVLGECPGVPWRELDDLDDGVRWRLRAELGEQVARLHSITGNGFGYPSGALGTLQGDWAAAFQRMVDAVLADAERFAVILPRPVAEVQAVFAAQAPALAAVDTPVLVHFDLWDGNVLVDRSAGTASVTALIDAERAFWGDPVADFVSLALWGDIERDDAFLAGYRAAGGTVTFDAGTRRRLALYRAYLNLIMLVEAVPRQFPPAHVRWLHDRLWPALTASLATFETKASV